MYLSWKHVFSSWKHNFSGYKDTFFSCKYQIFLRLFFHFLRLYVNLYGELLAQITQNSWLFAGFSVILSPIDF